MERVYDRALEFQGSVLFFDPARHAARLMSGDKAVALGEGGRKTVGLSGEVRYDIETLDFEFVA